MYTLAIPHSLCLQVPVPVRNFRVGDPPPPSSSRCSATCHLGAAACCSCLHRARLGGARFVHYETPRSSSAPTELVSVERGLCTTRRRHLLPSPPGLRRWSAASALYIARAGLGR